MGGASSSERRSSAAANNALTTAARAQPSTRSPQIRCYHCHGIFTSVLAGQTHHVRCPYCSTINGVPVQGGSLPSRANSLAAAMQAPNGDLSPMAQQRQEQLLRRLQAREITPLELLILREFVEHLQQNRSGAAGASSHEIDSCTAEWVVDDVGKLPEELRTCCVCLEDVCCEQRVRTLPCLHTFHAECVEEWLQKKKVCPLCQFPISSETNVDGDSAAAPQAADDAAAD
mmetsp:Transcript_21744/g.46836  ORF Transcript_21744/g.46836 Transcript_21744/m.46836 type:complete len:230 (-) Transcript_21744:417-1106(-)